ncbi:MAG: Bifunctional oligoribonuclease and PAP phosphatase NrnA [Syntrophus sp. SKADARSKE-3]|nr:Bifunctional oligoribonuclease and PAP phosphatase NrnA [Syntrophus sp. SKADARSKE-3]
MIPRIVEIIRRNNKFLITAHVRLDGDALGSELALFRILTDMGKTVTVYNQDPTPANYLFLPGGDQIIHTLEETDSYDAVFVLDCSELERVGSAAEIIGAMRQIVNIDHHVSNAGFSDVKLIDPHASSTGELIFRVISQMDVPIAADVATNLYTAILTDTGGFRYGNTTKDALTIAGCLVEYGAKPQSISQYVYENNPPAKILLLSRVLQTLTFDLDGKVGSLVVYQRDLDETGALHDHTEGFIDIPRTVEGTMISILYSQISENRFKVSLRSKDNVDIERVAWAFGGGGHINAAACRVDGDIETIKRRILEEIRADRSV